MDMKENDSLRNRLIIAGIDEIYTHGISDFSLRRVAAACNTSCAAPYKHFQNKEQLILKIVEYINTKWELLSDEIISLYADDVKKQLLEVSMAYIRFWIANPDFRSVFKESHNGMDIRNTKFRNILDGYFDSKSLSDEEKRIRKYGICAIVHGTISMIESKVAENEKETFEITRRILTDILTADKQKEDKKTVDEKV